MTIFKEAGGKHKKVLLDVYFDVYFISNGDVYRTKENMSLRG